MILNDKRYSLTTSSCDFTTSNYEWLFILHCCSETKHLRHSIRHDLVQNILEFATMRSTTCGIHGTLSKYRSYIWSSVLTGTLWILVCSCNDQTSDIRDLNLHSILLEFISKQILRYRHKDERPSSVADDLTMSRRIWYLIVLVQGGRWYSDSRVDAATGDVAHLYANVSNV